MPDDAILTQTIPNGPTTRTVPHSIASVWLLVARWDMAIIPNQDGTWTVHTAPTLAVHMRTFAACRVPFARLPHAIAALAAQAEAAAQEGER